MEPADKEKSRQQPNRADQAIACFHQGFNCAQAIFSAYCEPLGLDTESAMKVAGGFGGGMGRMGETCGAITGAYMLIGLKHGQTLPRDSEARNKTYELVRAVADKFRQQYGSTRCKEILGLDLLTADKQIAAEQLKTICPKIIRDVADIIENTLAIE